MTFEAVKVKKMHAFEKVLGCSAMFFFSNEVIFTYGGMYSGKKGSGEDLTS